MRLLCLSSRTADLHPPLGLSNDLFCPLLDQGRMRESADLGPQMGVVVIQGQPVDVDLDCPSGDALLHEVWLETVGTVKSDRHATVDLRPNLRESANGSTTQLSIRKLPL